MSNMNTVKDTLGNRMKEYYEGIPKTKLMRRTPVIIRLDGSHFHTFTRGFQKPFDEVLIKTMQETTKYLCENIQGVAFSYQQSDEITLVLVDYKKLNSSAWFDYEVQKMCSTSAAMATMAFNKFFANNVDSYILELVKNITKFNNSQEQELLKTYKKAIDKGATFDSRVFNIPKEEVTNCVYWRQLDASRNSVQMLAQSLFSHKELQNKSCAELQDMMVLQKGVNWNDLDTYKKRGSCVVRNKIIINSDGIKETVQLRDIAKSENEWIIDKEIPIFKGEDGRSYIERLINFE